MVGLLIWIDLVSRFLLLAAAWTATGRQPVAPDDCTDTPEEGIAVDVDDRPPGGRGLVGPLPRPADRAADAGAAAGAEPPASRRRAGRRAAAAATARPTPSRSPASLVGTGAALGAGAAAAGRRYLRRRH